MCSLEGMNGNGHGNGGGGVAGGNNNGTNHLQQSMPATRSWIKQFCHAQPILVEIDRSFIEDSFNLYGLKQLVHDFSIAMCIILDKKPNETYTRDMIQSAMLLYGLIHARFICTSRGLELMKRKYVDGYFGVCSRYLCHSQHVLPIGITDQPNTETMKYFCPSCQDVYCYTTGHFSVDAAYIGPHFPHIFFMTYENLVPISSPGAYAPRIFGFKVHHSSPSLCQVGPKRSSTIEPFRTTASDTTSTTVTTTTTIQHVNGRRSALPFLDQENEDDSDGDYGALPPPPRLFSPVNSTVSVSSTYSSTYPTPTPNSYSHRSPNLSRESSSDYGTILRGVKRDSSGQEVGASAGQGYPSHLPQASSSSNPNPRRK